MSRDHSIQCERCGESYGGFNHDEEHACEQPRNRLKPRTYHEFREAISLAISAGYRRAHKHTDRPSEEHVCEQVEREVMGVLCEMVEFGEVSV